MEFTAEKKMYKVRTVLANLIFAFLLNEKFTVNFLEFLILEGWVMEFNDFCPSEYADFCQYRDVHARILDSYNKAD